MNTREQSNAIKKAIAEVDLDLIGEASEIDDVFSLIFQSGEKKIPDWFHLLWSGSSVRKPSGDGTQQGSKTMQEKETKSKYSHMASDDRVKIESGLNCKLPYKEIAENIHKSATTVSREVAKHSVIDRSGGWCRRFNDCIHRENCTMSFACDKHKDCIRLDEPKAVRYRKPYRPNSKPSSRTGSSIPREVLKGHTYADFLVLKRVKPRHHVEMDCVPEFAFSFGKWHLLLE